MSDNNKDIPLENLESKITSDDLLQKTKHTATSKDIGNLRNKVYSKIKSNFRWTLGLIIVLALIFAFFVKNIYESQNIQQKPPNTFRVKDPATGVTMLLSTSDAKIAVDRGGFYIMGIFRGLTPVEETVNQQTRSIFEGLTPIKVKNPNQNVAKKAKTSWMDALPYSEDQSTSRTSRRT